MRPLKLLVLLAPLGLLLNSNAFAANSALAKLFDKSWQEDLADDPLMASQLGIHAYDDKLPDLSEKYLLSREQRDFKRLTAIRAIKREKLDKGEQINWSLFELDAKNRIDTSKFKPEMYAPRTFDGPQQFAQIAETLPFKTAKDYDNWIARLNASGIYFDQWIALLNKGVMEKRVQPRVVIDKVLAQISAQVTADPAASPLYAPFKKIPDGIDAATQTRLTTAGLAAVQTVALPGLQRLEKFFRDVYLPATRNGDQVGIWSTPDGDLYYANRVKYFTTTNLSAIQIHNIGLKEVARIRGEMEKALEGINFLGTVDQFLNELRINPRFFYKTPEELLAAYEKTARAIEPQLPKLFGKLPKTPFTVRAIPAEIAPSSTAAYYQPPSMDGSRGGVFYVNLYKVDSRPIHEVDVLTAHESVPGHHLQTALQYELGQSLPPFRRNATYTAYVEGWALYSEGLGYQLGLYQDDFTKFSQLNYDLWRAVRLVVDTGMHNLKWSRDYAIYYFRTNTAKTQLEVENEIDRYISWPGQALAYKIGQLKIQELRAKAEKALGDRFDIRAFHDQFLGTGALPLSVVETEMDAWIAAQSARR